MSAIINGGGGVVGGTFGAGPSSGFTFTSTPILTAPFLGNLIIGVAVNQNGGGPFTAGAGYTLVGSTNVLGLEYATAGNASSYSAPFGFAPGTGNWGAGIAVFAATNPALVQGRAQGSANSLAYTSNNTLGNCLVATFRYTNSAGGPITSVTDTRGNTWVNTGLRIREGYSKGAGDSVSAEIWYALNCAVGANTVTANGISGVTCETVISEFSGVALSNALIDYAFAGSTTSTMSVAGATTNPQYLIQAVNNVTGKVSFSGTDAAAVVRSAVATLAGTGGLLYFKNGIYPGQTALQENVQSQTNFYVFGLPAATGAEAPQISWVIEGESFAEANYAFLPTDGVIFNILPSAWAGAQPSNTLLSGWWQRPPASGFNNALYFENICVRIPDNQRSAYYGIDALMSTYLALVNIQLDTAVAALDQVGSGLTAAVSGVNGVRTNSPSTDEFYAFKTWVIGYSTPYNVISDHHIMINPHAAFNVNAGTFTNTTGDGGITIHYQDIHNLNGVQISCGIVGTRMDFLNMIVENNSAGTFSRQTNATESPAGNGVGRIDVSTTITGGGTTPAFFSAGGANFKISESYKIYMPGIINPVAPSAATTGTSKQTLASFTFLYNSGGGFNAGIFQNNPGAVVRIKAWGITATNGNSKVVELDFGGTAIATITSTVSNGVIELEAEIIIKATSVQEILGRGDDTVTRTLTRTSPGITGTANIVLNLAATTASQAGDFTFEGWTIEYLGGN